jgi:hypothetical protein
MDGLRDMLGLARSQFCTYLQTHKDISRLTDERGVILSSG